MRDRRIGEAHDPVLKGLIPGPTGGDHEAGRHGRGGGGGGEHEHWATSMGDRGMICRTWRGWAERANADTYESIVRGQVIPGIEAMRVPGFRHIDLMRRDLGDEVEFLTIMWFEDIDSIKAFVGEDYEMSHVPAGARAVLARFDERSAHYTVLDRRPQCGSDPS